MAQLIKDKYKNWMSAWVVMTAIFMMSSIQGSVIQAYGLGKESYHVNGHFLMFFLLYFCLYKAIKSIKWSLIFTVIYAFLDELHQYFVPLRSVSTKDLLVDTLAAVVGALIIWKLSQLLPKKLNNWLKN